MSTSHHGNEDLFLELEGEVHVKREPLTLEDMQEIVGGYIQVVYLENGEQLIVDEDGLMKQKFPNRKASILAQRLIVGVAILLKGDAKLK